MLAGLSGEDLANSPENLCFTNQSLNNSLRATDIKTYVEAHPDLSQEQKDRLLREYEQSGKSYEDKINRAYYTRPGFRQG